MQEVKVGGAKQTMQMGLIKAALYLNVYSGPKVAVVLVWDEMCKILRARCTQEDFSFKDFQKRDISFFAQPGRIVA